jgi:ubiquinone biosynthesis protein COQ4
MKNPIKTLRMLKGFYLLSQDPNRLEQVFEIGDSGENTAVLKEVAEYVSRDPSAARALREMPRVGRLDLSELRKNPEGSLGRVFAEHMIENKLDPAAIPIPDVASDRDLRFVKAHLRETHDIWHVVTGFGTDVAGEIGLQAFYLAQLPSRLSSILIGMAFVHIATVNPGARDAIMTEMLRGWTIGKRAKLFFGVDWKKYWTTPLSDVRRMLDVEPGVLAAPLPAAHQTYFFVPKAA